MSEQKQFRLIYVFWGFLGVLFLLLSCAMWFVYNYSGRINKEPLSEYACEVEFDDYSWRLLDHACTMLCMPKGGRCLGFVKDDFACHNLDWLLLDEVECVVRINGNNKRQSSLSISSCNPYFKKSDIRNPWTVFSTCLLPAMAVDGINESGVFVCVNVAPKGEGRERISDWDYGEITTLGTNPDSETSVCDILLTRYLLDNATSACVEEDPSSAWNLIQKVNWYASAGDVMDEELHWLIADEDSCFVLEFIDNRPVKLSGEKVMSNFYLGVNGGLQPHGEGYERFGIVTRQYDSIQSIDDVKRVMEEAHYGNAYHYSAADTAHFRYSDFLLPHPYGEPDEEFVAYADSIVASEVAIPAREPDCQRWATRHTSIYNLKERSLTVSFDEEKVYVKRIL